MNERQTPGHPGTQRSAGQDSHVVASPVGTTVGPRVGDGLLGAEEVLVGKLPLRVDILLIRREAGQLSEASQRDLSALVPLLNRFTLIEFKGPTDALEPATRPNWSAARFLWHSQQTERLPQPDVSLIVLAPNLNGAVRDELRCLGWQISGHEAGVYRVTGGPFTTWLVETDAMAKVRPADPVAGERCVPERAPAYNRRVGAYGTFGPVALRASAGGSVSQLG